MKKFYYLLLISLLVGMLKVQAQSTIGAGTQPQEFSVLELISGNYDNIGGLRLPQLSEGERTTLTNSPAFQAEKTGKALGLTIYNKTSDCVEYWNGTKWVSRCEQVCCMAPPLPCPIMFNFSREPLWLNDIFTASVTPVTGLSYKWEVPSSMSILGSSLGSSIVIKSTTPGILLLSGINVTATNDCGSSSVCSGSGIVRVLDCDRAPNASDVNLVNVNVEGTDSGTGTSADPYVVGVGDIIQITYQNPSSSIYYMWSLDAEGQNYFDLVSSGDGFIMLRAKSYNVNGAACGAGAIRLSLRSDCGELLNLESNIRIKIYSCNNPYTPQISAPATVYENQLFAVAVASVTGESYTWELSDALKNQVDVISGENTAVLMLRNKVSAGNTINLSGLKVTAANSCGTATATGTGTINVISNASISIVCADLYITGFVNQNMNVAPSINIPYTMTGSSYSLSAGTVGSYGNIIATIDAQTLTSSSGYIAVKFSGISTSTFDKVPFTLTIGGSTCSMYLSIIKPPVDCDNGEVAKAFVFEQNSKWYVVTLNGTYSTGGETYSVARTIECNTEEEALRHPQALQYCDDNGAARCVGLYDRSGNQAGRIFMSTRSGGWLGGIAEATTPTGGCFASIVAESGNRIINYYSMYGGGYLGAVNVSGGVGYLGKTSSIATLTIKPLR